MSKEIIHFNGRKMSSKNEQAYWDFRAEEYCRNADPEKARKGKSFIVDQLIKKEVLNKDSHVLDIGCGPGTLSLALARKVGQVTAADISPAGRQCRK